MGNTRYRAKRLEEKILTIVVPSYHTQAYIDRCIPAMLNHPYAGRMELLLVNDGSTDGTLKKLNWYAGNFPETVTVVDKENGGHGSVINTGIRLAKGRFFKVVDGDDWVVPHNLGRMLHDLARCSADLAVHPFIKYDSTNKKGKTIRYAGNKNRAVKFDEAAPKLREVEIHAAAYRTALLREHKVRVREHCFYEDTEYNLFPLPYVETLRVFSYPVSVYRTGSGTQSVAPKQAFQNRAMHHKIVWDCIGWFEKKESALSPQKRAYVKRVICRLVRSQYMLYLKNRITGSQLEELAAWDRKLQKRSACFYQATNRFPLDVLRGDIRRMYPPLRRFYQIYAKLP